MGKFPRFLVVPGDSSGDGKTYLICTRKPGFVGEIISYSKTAEIDRYLQNPDKEHFVKVGEESKVLHARTFVKGKALAMYVLDFIDNPGSDSRQEGLMNRVGDWLFNYYSKTNTTLEQLEKIHAALDLLHNLIHKSGKRTIEDYENFVKSLKELE